MQNGVKNGKKTQFSSTNQPSSRAKSRGWTKKRQRQQFINTVLKYQNMTIKELEQLEKDMKKNKQDFRIGELMALKYVSKLIDSDKFLIDWIDRTVGKATVFKPEEKPKDKKFDEVVINIVRTREEAERLASQK